VKFRIAMPGNNHIPPANEAVPAAEQWVATLTAPQFQEIVAAIDELSYAAITTSEHLGMPYFEVPRLGPWWMDALSVMSFVAGATRRVRVDATVLVVPYHHPLAFAKALSTIDVLSGGRLDVSIGVGHAVQEFEVLGVPFEARGAITDETLAAMEVLWSDDEPVFHGRFFHIEGLAFEPKPLQRPRPPIFVGGNSKPALRRAARYDGWQPNPTQLSIEEIPPLFEYLAGQADYVGKEDTFEVFWVGAIPGVGWSSFDELSEPGRRGLAERALDKVTYLAGLGVTTVSVPVPQSRSMAQYLDYVTWFSEEVIDKAK